MKELLEKMMDNKQEKGKLSEQEIEAKMDVLKELLGLAQSEHGNRVKSGLDEMKKVTVAAPDKESLEKGLEKAQEIVKDPKEALSLDNEEQEESSEHEELESPEKESLEESLVKKLEEAPEMEKPEVEEEEEDSIFASKRPKSKIQKLMMD